MSDKYIVFMKYKLAFFDMDGTILNTLDDLADSCNYVLERNGFPVHTSEEIKFMVGNGIPKLIERALPEGTDPEVYKKILTEYIAWYEKHCSIKTGPYEGMVQCLEKLKAAGLKLAVNTNKVQSAAEELCKKYFPDIFDVISGSHEGISPKPSPDGINEVLSVLQFSSDECVFIGDSDVDIMTGRNAGIDEIGVDWGFRGADFLKNHGAECIVYNCEELLNKILDV